MACAVWVIAPNATFTRVLIVRDSTGTEVDLTGYNARMDFKQKVGLNETIIFSLTDGDGLTVAGEDAVYDGVTYHNGVIRIVVTPTQAKLLDGMKGVTDLLLEASGAVTNLYTNPVKSWVCTKGVTEASF